MRRIAKLLNQAVARDENYIRDFHHTACQTHDIASAALAEGWTFVKSLRKYVLSLKAERDKFKDDSRDYKNESELTKSRLEAITEVKLNKAREVTRLTSDLKGNPPPPKSTRSYRKSPTSHPHIYDEPIQVSPSL